MHFFFCEHCSSVASDGLADARSDGRRTLVTNFFGEGVQKPVQSHHKNCLNPCGICVKE